MSSDQNRLNTKLSLSYVIGGSPCSGKSTIAERLAKEFDLYYYNADAHVLENIKHSTPDAQPTMVQYSKLSWNEIWSRPVEFQVNEEIHFYQELFPFILNDLDAFDDGSPIIMEGAAFLPELLDQRLFNPSRVLFMVPTPDFQISHYRNRPWIQPILKSCDDPKFAFRQWMKRDELFGMEVTRQAVSRGLGVFEVDGAISIEDEYRLIKQKFGLD